jgi:glycosyltransferase involved in cell wall biosynthesis
VGEAARLIEPTNARELAHSIIGLWESEEERQRLSKLGRIRAAAFTWERTARLTLDVYDEVLQET